LKQAKDETLEKIQVAKQEKYDLQAKFEEDREHIHREKDQLFAEQTAVKEVVARALCSMLGVSIYFCLGLSKKPLS
jgi:hypothetical protein